MVREETKQPFPAFVLPTFCFVRAPRDWEGRRGGGGWGGWGGGDLLARKIYAVPHDC